LVAEEKETLSVKDRVARGEKISDILAGQDSKQEELKNKPKPKKIDEHVDLEQADKEARQRARSHPTYGRTKEIPDRWSSTGQKFPKPGEKK